jgi:hypothetical protein
MENSSPDFADLAFIRKHVPIEGVARELGMEVTRGHSARCWRVANHRNGDVHPSLRFHVRKNRARCFVCDQFGGFSNIDLVMRVRNCDLHSALEFISLRFPVPNIRPGRPIGSRSKPKPFRVGATGSDLEVVVRSGLFGKLSPTARSILCVLFYFRDPETEDTRMSYGALVRYAGVSRGSIAKALRQLAQLHAVTVTPGSRVDGLVRSCNGYHVTLDHSALQEHMTAIYRSERQEVERDRNYRRELRKTRISNGRGKRAVDRPRDGICHVDLGRGLRARAPALSLSTPLLTPKGKGTSACIGLNLSSFSELKSNFLGQEKYQEIRKLLRRLEQKSMHGAEATD